MAEHDLFFVGSPILGGAVRTDQQSYIGMCAFRHGEPGGGASCREPVVAHASLQVVVDAMSGHRRRAHPDHPYTDGRASERAADDGGAG